MGRVRLVWLIGENQLGGIVFWQGGGHCRWEAEKAQLSQQCIWGSKASRQLRKFEILIYRWEAYVKRSTDEKQYFSDASDLFCRKEKEKLVLEFMWNCKRPGIAKTILKKKVAGVPNPVSELTLGTVIKTVWYWDNDRHTDQWTRTVSPEINPDTYPQLIFCRDVRSLIG